MLFCKYLQVLTEIKADIEKVHEQAICGKFNNSSKLGKLEQFQYLKKTLREFDNMTDCLEQVRNDVKVTNEKLSALNTNSKSTRPKTKENKIVKHDNAKKSKKRKEKRVSNRTWDIVVMVMNEKAYLEVVELRENSVKLATAPDMEFLQNATPKGNLSG